MATIVLDLDVGDSREVDTTFVDDAGSPTNTSPVTATIRHPDGTETSITPVNTGTGVYTTATPVFDAPGVWELTVTGGGTAQVGPIDDTDRVHFVVGWPSRTLV